MTAGIEKVFASDPKLGFLAHAASLAGSTAPTAGQLIRNDVLNTVVALVFMSVVALLLVVSLREWWLILSKRRPATVTETPFVESAYAR